MLLHGIETRETLLVPLSYTFCFVGWIQNLAVCYGVQHYIASLLSTKTLAKQNIICIFSWMHIYHTLLLKVESFAAPFTSLSKLTTYAGAKPGIFLTFFHLVLICRVKCGGAPVSTGDALIGSVIITLLCCFCLLTKRCRVELPITDHFFRSSSVPHFE
jgi:hypothetical protein